MIPQVRASSLYNISANNAHAGAPTSCRSYTCIIAQPDERFTRQKAIARQLSALSPVFPNGSRYKDIEPTAKLYSQFLLLPDGGLVALQTQHVRWQQYCHGNEKRPP
jgi:hypothetical protein